MAIKLKNNALSFVQTAIGASDTSLAVASGDGTKYPSLNSGDWFYVTVADPVDATIYEIMKVTAISGDTLTVERGAEGTTPRSIAVDDIVEQRATAQTLYDIADSGSSYEDRVYIDEIFFSIKGATQFDDNKIRTYNKKFAPKLIDTWDSFWHDKVKCQVQDLTNNNVYDGLEFSSISDMADWVNANVAVDGSGNSEAVVVCKVYDTIDTSIPQLTRAFGINKLFSSLIDGRNAKTNSYIINKLSFMDDVYNTIFGKSVTGVPNEVFWVPNTKQNKYGLGAGNNYKITYSDGSASSRQIVTVSDDNYNSLKSGSLEFKITGDRYLVSMDLNGNLSFCSRLEGNVESIMSEHKVGSSLLQAFAVRNVSDTDRQALVLKPLGIDQVLIEIPDFTKYNLEFVKFNDDSQTYVALESFSSVTDLADGSNYDINGNKVRISSNKWMTESQWQRGSYNKHQYDRVYFRLRDTKTGAVSKLSTFYLETQMAHKFDAGAIYLRNK